MKVMFSAGEASGDTHAASVANALKEIDPSVDMFGMGGTLMERAGVRIVYDIKNLGVIGIEGKTGYSRMCRLSWV